MPRAAQSPNPSDAMQHVDLPCDAVRERLSARLDGEERDPGALAIHLARCAECAQHERDLSALSDSFARLRDAEQPPADLWPSIERRARLRARQQILARAAAALVGFTAIGASLLALQRRAPPPAQLHVLERLASSPDAALMFASLPEYHLLRTLSAPEEDR